MPSTIRRFNFFGLGGSPDAPDVHRLLVTQELQAELSAEFRKQLDEFNVDGREHIDYAQDPQYVPEEDELFEVRDFALPQAFSGLASAPDLSSVTDELIESGAIRAVIGAAPTASGKLLLCFQALDNRQLLKRTRFSILLSRDTFERNAQSGIVIRSALTAIYRDGNLYFPKEPPVRRFLDLSQLFAEATDPQVRAFLTNRVFAVDDGDAVLAAADKWTRRKIASIEQRGILRALSLRVVLKTAVDFNIDVSTRRVDGKQVIVVPSSKRPLKDLLRLLDQDFLASTITSDRFRVGSKLRLAPR